MDWSAGSVEAAAGSNLDFGVAIVSIMFLVLGIVIGERIGEEVASRCVTKRDYWLANLAIVLVGILASALVWATGWVVFAAVTIGLMAGAIAGTKLGFGESTGPWKFHDQALGVNKGQVKAAKSARAEEARRRRRAGEPEPELMSVATPAQEEPSKNSAGPNGSRHA